MKAREAAMKAAADKAAADKAAADKAAAAPITKSNCLDRAKAEYGDKVTAKRSKLTAGNWNHVPQGCSVQSGGIWAAHWNYKDGTNDGGYTKVGDTGTTITKSNCLDRAKSEYGDKVTAKRSKLSAGNWNHLPQGCSVQSGGDWAAHWNVKDGKNDGGYTKVGDTEKAAAVKAAAVKAAAVKAAAVKASYSKFRKNRSGKNRSGKNRSSSKGNRWFSRFSR